MHHLAPRDLALGFSCVLTCAGFAPPGVAQVTFGADSHVNIDNGRLRDTNSRRLTDADGSQPFICGVLIIMRFTSAELTI